jgi:hypothetical protein
LSQYHSFSFDVIFKELKETGSLSRKRKKEIKIVAEMYGINLDTYVWYFMEGPRKDIRRTYTKVL